MMNTYIDSGKYIPCQGKKENEKGGKRVTESFIGKLKYNPEEKVIILWTFSKSRCLIGQGRPQ
jgi:hypothetical protein